MFSDVPSEVEDTKSIRFKKGSEDPYNWFGNYVTVCKGDHLVISVWLKFVGSVPHVSDNFGLKYHGDPDNTAGDGHVRMSSE